MGLAEDVGDLFYLPILLALNVLRAVDGKVNLISLFAWFEVFVLGIEADVSVVVEIDV